MELSSRLVASSPQLVQQRHQHLALLRLAGKALRRPASADGKKSFARRSCLAKVAPPSASYPNKEPFVSEQVADLPLPVQSQWSVVRSCVCQVLAALASSLLVSFVVGFVVAFVGAATRSASLLHLTQEFAYVQSLAILSMLMVNATYLLFARDELKERLRQFLPDLMNGLRRPVSLLILVCVPLGLLGSVHWAITTTLLTRNFLHDMSPIYWLAIAVLLVIVAPVAEEIFYRGYVWGRLSSIMPPWKAGTISAALFLGSHVPNGILAPLLVLPLTIVLTVLRLRRVGVSVCVLAHGIYNGTIILGNLVQTYVAPLHMPS